MICDISDKISDDREALAKSKSVTIERYKKSYLNIFLGLKGP